MSGPWFGTRGDAELVKEIVVVVLLLGHFDIWQHGLELSPATDRGRSDLARMGSSKLVCQYLTLPFGVASAAIIGSGTRGAFIPAAVVASAIAAERHDPAAVGARRLQPARSSRGSRQSWRLRSLRRRVAAYRSSQEQESVRPCHPPACQARPASALRCHLRAEWSRLPLWQSPAAVVLVAGCLPPHAASTAAAAAPVANRSIPRRSSCVSTLNFSIPDRFTAQVRVCRRQQCMPRSATATTYASHIFPMHVNADAMIPSQTRVRQRLYRGLYKQRSNTLSHIGRMDKGNAR